MPVQAPMRKQVLQGYMPFGSIGWVGNDKVVFSGFPVGSKSQTSSLYLWDLKHQPRKLLEHSHSSCVSGGTIRTAQFNDKGTIRPIALTSPDFTPQSRIDKPAPMLSKFDPVSCSWITTPEKLRDQEWRPLRNGEGFLDFGPSDDSPDVQGAIRLTTATHVRHETGIHTERLRLPQAVYSYHDNSYLIFDLAQTSTQRQNWLEANKRTIWRLDKHLHIYSLNIPAGPWVGIGTGTISFLPTRPGVLITSNNFTRTGAPGGAGLYLLRPDTAAQRLERGLAQEAAVSTDGCRVAYAFKPRLDTGTQEGGPRLAILDICPERNNTKN